MNSFEDFELSSFNQHSSTLARLFLIYEIDFSFIKGIVVKFESRISIDSNAPELADFNIPVIISNDR